MTHDELVERAIKWLKSTGRCGVAVPKLVTWCDEQPDALGWRSRGAICILIECKTSRADFLVDQNKYFRRAPWDGIGNKRYYMTPPGIVGLHELPELWGLLEVQGKIVQKVKESGDFEIADHNFKSVAFMYSLLRRCERRGLLKKCLSDKWKKRQ